MKIEDYRQKINSIDTEILILLNQRAEIAKEIGTIKAKAGLPIVDRQREEEVLRRILRENEGSLNDEAAARIYTGIIRESRQIQLDLTASIAQDGQVK